MKKGKAIYEPIGKAGEFDTKTMVLKNIPGRTRAFGKDEEAELAIEDG